MKVENLQKLLVEELRDLYSAEKQLLKSLPKVVKKASSAKLKKAVEKHRVETEQQVERLEKVFELLGEKARAKKCLAMEGLIEEVQELMQEDIEPDVLDAGLIAAAQRIEHYEMAGYGCVRTYANLLGNTKAAKLLQKTLDEEGKTDKILTQLAESINVEAINDGTDSPKKAARGKRTTASTKTPKAAAKRSSTAAGKRTSAKKSTGRRKLAPTRTEDNENYEAMMAEGTTTGESRDTIGNDAQNALYSDALNRNRESGGAVDVERQSEQEDTPYNERTGNSTAMKTGKRTSRKAQ